MDRPEVVVDRPEAVVASRVVGRWEAAGAGWSPVRDRSSSLLRFLYRRYPP